MRGTVEEALNAMLDAEADRLCGAGRYERSEARKDKGAAIGAGVGAVVGAIKKDCRSDRRVATGCGDRRRNSRSMPVRALAENLPETVNSDSSIHDATRSIIPTRRNRAVTSS